MNKLQMGLIGGAIFFVSIGILILTGVLPGLRTGSNAPAALTMWGFMNEDVLQQSISEYTNANQNTTIKYKKKDLASFEDELLNAIVRQEAPDVIMFPSSFIHKDGDILSPAPAALFNERILRQDYVDAATAFLNTNNEVIGVPLYANALLLYWNSDLFTKNNIPTPPKTWDEFLDAAQKITRKDSDGNIAISGAAMGRAQNIANAPLILRALFLQAREKIIDEQGKIVLGDSIKKGEINLRPAETALRFFSDFANPKKTAQSWSGALPEAKDLFINAKLGLYLGLMDDYVEIARKNPHLSFSIAPLPQIKDAERPITTGSLVALSVTKASRSKTAAWALISHLTRKEAAIQLAQKTGGVALRRDLLPTYSTEYIRSVFAKSVFILSLWPISDAEKLDRVLKNLIENAAYGKGTLRDTIEQAKAELESGK